MEYVYIVSLCEYKWIFLFQIKFSENNNTKNWSLSILL